MSGRRIAYVQFTNPANYPPLIHSAHILADDGWDVLFLGAAAYGTGDQEVEPHPRIRTDLSPRSQQVDPKAAYARFASRTLRSLVKFRPDVVYASDLWSCPIAAAASAMGVRVVYHEHDELAPSPSVAARLCFAARALVAKRALTCVIPNAQRAARFAARYPAAKTTVVWNCPSLREVAPPRAPANGPFRLYYHGSLVPQRLPRAMVQVLDALPDVRLRVLGYQTVGAPDYLPELQRLTEQLGISDRLETRSTRERHHIWPEMDDADAGLALVPTSSDDANLETMSGASNKPFDYLARGLALIVTDRADWRGIFGEYGAVCDPGDVESLISAVRSLAGNRERTRALAEKGRQRILVDWNYEHQFEPVRKLLNA